MQCVTNMRRFPSEKTILPGSLQKNLSFPKAPRAEQPSTAQNAVLGVSQGASNSLTFFCHSSYHLSSLLQGTWTRLRDPGGLLPTLGNAAYKMWGLTVSKGDAQGISSVEPHGHCLLGSVSAHLKALPEISLCMFHCDTGHNKGSRCGGTPSRALESKAEGQIVGTQMSAQA